MWRLPSVHKTLLLNALIDVRDSGPQYPNCGICTNVQESKWYRPHDFEVRRQFNNCMRGLMQSWPLYAGDLVHPVPHPELSASEAYHHSKIAFWDFYAEYGQNRWNLLHYMIEKLEEEINGSAC
jgi:hypothetical protein